MYSSTSRKIFQSSRVAHNNDKARTAQNRLIVMNYIKLNNWLVTPKRYGSVLTTRKPVSKYLYSGALALRKAERAPIW